jgi:hypothetical protein
MAFGGLKVDREVDFLSLEVRIEGGVVRISGIWVGFMMGALGLLAGEGGAAGTPSGALLGYCATRVEAARVCTEVVEIDPKDHLFERCAPWARWVEGKGWTFRNSRDEVGLREEHRKECARVVPLDSGTPYECWAVVSCPGAEAPRTEHDLGLRMRAQDRKAALARCAKIGAVPYAELLLSLASPEASPGVLPGALEEAIPECFLKMDVKVRSSVPRDPRQTSGG